MMMINMNHESWHRCRKCRSFFDLRMHGWDCPHCGSENRKKPTYRFPL